jgi:hypothetical protein
MLGRELASTYSSAEMMHLLTIHVKENVIDQEAANTMTGALTYKVRAFVTFPMLPLYFVLLNLHCDT